MNIIVLSTGLRIPCSSRKLGLMKYALLLIWGSLQLVYSLILLMILYYSGLGLASAIKVFASSASNIYLLESHTPRKDLALQNRHKTEMFIHQPILYFHRDSFLVSHLLLIHVLRGLWGITWGGRFVIGSLPYCSLATHFGIWYTLRAS